MQITQSHIDAWIKEQTQNLINDNDVVIGRKVVVDLKTFWIEVDNAFIEMDMNDDQFLATRSRISGELLERQKARDLKIIEVVAQRMLEPFAVEAIQEQAREEQEDYEILGYEVRKAEGWY